MHVALTIAGSDSGGGAGIQADLKTFHQFGVFGTSAITAITAQNTVGVFRWDAVTPELVRAQIDAVATDLRPAALKSGMLANEDIVCAVAEAVRGYGLTNYVVDPVMVATSGDLLIAQGGLEAIRLQLLPLATLVTPNAPEARVLTGAAVETESDMRRAAESIFALGPQAVLIKGGHVGMRDAAVIDLYFDGEFEVISHPRIESRNTHGTGCTLSAAITAQLALGTSLREAVRCAVDYVHLAMLSAPKLGQGHGPLNHFARGSFLTNSVTSA